jgi:hypothetical protein
MRRVALNSDRFGIVLRILNKRRHKRRLCSTLGSFGRGFLLQDFFVDDLILVERLACPNITLELGLGINLGCAFLRCLDTSANSIALSARAKSITL